MKDNKMESHIYYSPENKNYYVSETAPKKFKDLINEICEEVDNEDFQWILRTTDYTFDRWCTGDHYTYPMSSDDGKYSDLYEIDILVQKYLEI